MSDPNQTLIKNERYGLWSKVIIAISIIVPLLVVILFYGGISTGGSERDLSFMPMFHAILNGSAFLLLLGAWYFIKQRNIKAHSTCTTSALFLSAIFLVSYVIYHGLTEPTSYGGEGVMRYIYYFILITHIVLSAVILPIVLFTFLRAWTGRFEQHRKIARWTMPIWLYVTLTGVLVYLMISPYY